jgi:GNAT superfamily N-acetyltransferase
LADIALVKAADIESPGVLYEVEVNAEREQLADWDAKLSEQSEDVQAFFNDKGIAERYFADAYRSLAATLGGSDRASAALREIGVSGVRFTGDSGAENYVIFDDSILKITKKNGKPVKAAERQQAVDQMFALRAFHGSPHDFDRFSMDRIGTGEGAQAFGHGLYFAEEPNVAKAYQLKLGKVDAESLRFFDTVEPEMQAFARTQWQEYVNNVGADRATLSEFLDMTWSNRKYSDQHAQLHQLVKSGEVTVDPRSGGLYEVEIDVEPEQLLDWDLPLSKQGAHVQEFFDSALAEDEVYQAWKRNGAIAKVNASLLYDRLSGPRGMQRGNVDGREMASQKLREAGIPGIRYLDQGSRAFKLDIPDSVPSAERSVLEWAFGNDQNIDRAKAKLRAASDEDPAAKRAIALLEDGTVTATQGDTRNIVIFDDSLVKITKKNGEPVSAEERQGVVDQMFALKKSPFDFENPGGGSRVAEVGDTEITYGVGKDNLVELILVKTPKAKRGQGSARQAMQQFLREADVRGLRVGLSADPMDAGISKAKLVDFYESLGFKRNSGNDRDFSTRLEFLREPQATLAMRRNQQGDLVAEAKFEREKMLVTISRAALDPVNSLHHEAVHALKERGLFRPTEWRLIEASAKSKGWLDNPLIKDYQKIYGRSLDDESIIEESFALAYQRHVKGDEIQKGALAKIFDRITAYLERIANYIRGRGPQTIEDLFRAIKQGDIGARAAPERRTDATSTGFTAAGAQTSQQGDVRLKGALGTEKALAFLSPAMRLQNSPSRAARSWVNELAETALTYEDHKSWIVTARGGAELGQPGSVETRVKLYDTNIAAGFKALDNLFIKYRKGVARRIPGDLTVTSLRDATAGPPAGKMDYRQFREAVSAAMRRGDEHDIPEVAEAAKVLRKEVFDPLLQRAIELKLLPEDVTPETAASYLNRIYNKERIVAERTEFRDVITKWLQETEINNAMVRGRLLDLIDEYETAAKSTKLASDRMKVRAKRDLERSRAGKEIDTKTAAAKDASDSKILNEQNAVIRDLRKQIEELVESYQGKTADEAKSALKSRGKTEEGRDADADRLASADKAVMKAARQIAAQTEKETIELEETATQIIDRILGTPEGRLSYDADMNKVSNRNYGGVDMDVRGPLAARQFMIPDARIEQWLENDIDVLMRAYVHTMAPDIELTARFGKPDMELQFKQINEEYARMAAATDDPQIRKRLHKQKNEDFHNLGAIRDRLRGTYRIPENPDAFHVRAIRGMMTLNYMRMLGGMTISAIPDASRFIHVHGVMGTFGDGIIPMFRSFSKYKKAGDETKWLSGALEMVTDNRAMRIADITDTFGRNTKFERGIQAAGRNFGFVSLMAPWNSVMKQLAGTITQTRILRGAERLISGKPLKQKEIEYFADLGISEGALRQIGGQFKKHGHKESNVWSANTAQWDEGMRPAIEALRVALRKEVDRLIVTPSLGERPKFASSLTGAMLLQFKSFAISATQKMLISGLQQKDLNALNGAAIAIALGGMVHILKGELSGRPVEIDWGNEEDVKQFLGNAFDRSGIAGVLMEFNNIAEKATDGRLGMAALTGKQISRYASRNLTASLLGPGFGLAEDSFDALNAALGTREWAERDTHNARQLLPWNNLFTIRRAFDEAEKGINQALGVPAR